MFARCLLLAALCLIPAAAADRACAEELRFDSTYLRYAIWQGVEFSDPISFTIEYFVEDNRVAKFFRVYFEPTEGEVRPPTFVLSATGSPPTRSITIDIDTLNDIRNNFGSVNPAIDLAGDGRIGLEDLNFVRNNFGLTYELDYDYLFSILEEYPLPESKYITHGEVQDACIVLLDPRTVGDDPFVVPCAEAANTPEPSTLALAGVALMALSRRIRSKCRP